MSNTQSNQNHTILAVEDGPISMPSDVTACGELWSIGYSISYGTLNGTTWYAWISGGQGANNQVLASVTGPQALSEIICLVANTVIAENNEETGGTDRLLELS